MGFFLREIWEESTLKETTDKLLFKTLCTTKDRARKCCTTTFCSRFLFWEGFNGHKSEHLLSNCPSLRFANGNPRTQSQPKGVGSIQTQPHSSARPSSEEPHAF